MSSLVCAVNSINNPICQELIPPLSPKLMIGSFISKVTNPVSQPYFSLIRRKAEKMKAIAIFYLLPFFCAHGENTAGPPDYNVTAALIGLWKSVISTLMSDT